MFRLQSQVDQELDYNRQLARIGCDAGDLLKRTMSPQVLQQLQGAIRSETLAVEERLRQVRGRRRRRDARLRNRTRTPEFRRKLADYIAIARHRDHVLLTRRSILKQCGDACAWSVLRTDPRLIVPLFSATRTHSLSGGIGLVGPVEVMTCAHESGEFLVVENDLTRCLGIGDLTVVRADGRWVRPLPIEIKSHGEFVEGAVVEVDMITSHSNHPVDQQVFDDLTRLLALKERVEPKVTPKSERQAREIQERSELLLRITQHSREVMPFSRRSLWDAMGNILTKAQHAGYAYDTVESGVAFVAVRNRRHDSATKTMRCVLEALGDMGFGGDKAYGSVTSHDFQTTDAMAAVAPPVPLWPVPGSARAELLTGDLFFACICDPTVWERAFEAQGVRWTEENGRWVLSRDGRESRLDPVEVQKLTLGVAFAGFSPQGIARTIATNL